MVHFGAGAQGKSRVSKSETARDSIYASGDFTSLFATNDTQGCGRIACGGDKTLLTHACAAPGGYSHDANVEKSTAGVS